MNNPNSNARALEIIKALIQGSDPQDNSPLPSDSVLNRSDVLRALLTASAAIQSVMDRNVRRAQLPTNVGRAWTDEEEADLIKAFEADTAVAEIAKAHQRTIRAIESRAVLMGLMKQSQRTTENSFHPKKRRKSE